MRKRAILTLLETPCVRLAILILLCGLLAPVSAQDILPPSGARVVGNGPKGVLLQWPGSAEEHFFVQVYTEGFPRFDEEVKGNTLSLPLDPGLSYWWRVTRKKGHAFEEVVPNRLFELVKEPEFVLTGKDGSIGSPGLPGEPPQSVAVTLSPVGSYTKIFISVVPSNRIFYLAPGSRPFLVGARGGKGGDGYPGRRSTSYYYDPDKEPLVVSARDGGDGGNGGPGGSITVVSNGLKVLDFLVLDVEGGTGGEGDAGTSESEPGENGRPGRNGCVSIRERAR